MVCHCTQNTLQAPHPMALPSFCFLLLIFICNPLYRCFSHWPSLCFSLCSPFFCLRAYLSVVPTAGTPSSYQVCSLFIFIHQVQASERLSLIIRAKKVLHNILLFPPHGTSHVLRQVSNWAFACLICGSTTGLWSPLGRKLRPYVASHI